MSEKTDKFNKDLHAPAFVGRFQFKSLSCSKCKQGFQMRDGDLQFFNDVGEMWAFAKREHRKAPRPCVTPELIVIYSPCLLSYSLVKEPSFADIIEQP